MTFWDGAQKTLERYYEEVVSLEIYLGLIIDSPNLKRDGDRLSYRHLLETTRVATVARLEPRPVFRVYEPTENQSTVSRHPAHSYTRFDRDEKVVDIAIQKAFDTHAKLYARDKQASKNILALGYRAVGLGKFS